MKQLKKSIKSIIRQYLTESYNNPHLMEVKPNKYVYHTSNPIFRDKIAEHGLIPKGKSESWLEDTKIEGEVIFAVNSNDRNYMWDSTYDDDFNSVNFKPLIPNVNYKLSIEDIDKIPYLQLELLKDGKWYVFN